MRKIAELLRKYDHIWGLPLAILLLIGGNTLANKYFNDPLISTEYLAPLFYTACVITGFHAVVHLGMYLNHRNLFQSYNLDHSFNTFQNREKVIMYLLMYVFYTLLALVVFIYANQLMFA